MAIFTILNLSNLEEARRIDAEFYHPKKVKAKKTLEEVGARKIRDCFMNVRQIFDPKRHVLKESALVFDLSNIQSYFLEGGKIALSSEEVGSSKKIFFKNDVLISRLRPYLKEICFIGFNTKVKLLASTEFLVLRQKNREYYPEVLFTFLMTDYIQNILIWSITGTEHPRFNENYLLNLKLPGLTKETQKIIKKLVNQAWSNAILSKELYCEAENILLFELGLKDFKAKEKLSYEVNLSEINEAQRIDAECFNSSYKELINKIKCYKGGYDKLLAFVESIKPDFNPKKFPEKTFSYVELSDINTQIGIIQSSTNVKGEEAPSRARRVLKKNDVIVSSVEGSLEKVALVDEEHAGSLASTGFFQFRPKAILPEVLLVLSKSLILQTQLKKECAGTILTSVPKESIKKLIIPILPKQIQQKIAELVQKSHSKRKKAKELLETGKRAVEIAIERSEKEAESYLAEIENIKIKNN